MKKVTVKESYCIALNSDGCPDERSLVQGEGDILESWFVRDEDGFHFVYSHDFRIGYWVHPKLVEVSEC